MNKLYFTFIAGFTCIVFAKADDLGAYQLILDKQLLGAEKVLPKPVRQSEPVQAVPTWSREYRMTMITQDESGLRVGIQNLRDQTAYLLVEGDDSISDFKLVSGDYNNGTARIRYRGDEHVFNIEDGPATVSKEEAPASPVTVRSRSSVSEIRARRIRRPRSSPTPAPEPQVRKFNSREELQSHLEDQQMDAIRNGKPPLPIPLTPQMDNQLVKEGVLPPQ